MRRRGAVRYFFETLDETSVEKKGATHWCGNGQPFILIRQCTFSKDKMKSHYCNYPAVAKRIYSLPPSRLAYLNNGCFKHVIAMLEQFKEQTEYIKKVDASRFDPSTREYELQCGTKIQLMSKEPNWLNLPSGPFQLKHHLFVTNNGDMKDLISYVKDLYNFDLSEYMTAKSIKHLWLELQRAPEVMSDAEFSIKFTLAFANSFLAPTSWQKVNLDILRDIVPFERIDTLDWDGFTIDQLADGVRDVQNGSCSKCKGCVYLFLRAEKRVGQIEGVNSPPRGPALDGNLLVHAGTNSGPFSGSSTVSNLESTNSSAMNADDVLVKELNDRRILIEGTRHLIIESSGLEVEQGYEAHGGVHLNENEGDQHIDIAIPNEAAERDLEFVGEQMPGNEVVDHGLFISSSGGDGSTMQEQDEESNRNQSNVLHEEEQTPMDTMEEDQEVSADQGGNILVSLAAAQPPVDTMEKDQEVSAGQGGNNASVDAGNVVVPAAQPPASFVAAPQDQIHLDGNHGKDTRPSAAGEGNEDAGHAVIQGDNHGNYQPLLAAAAGEGNEDADHEVIQGDNHGNNQPLLVAAAGEGHEDEEHEVIQAAHDDLRRGSRPKKLNPIYYNKATVTNKDSEYWGESPEPSTATRERRGRRRGRGRRGMGRTGG